MCSPPTWTIWLRLGSTVDTPFVYANQLLELAETALATTAGGQIGVPETEGGPGGRALVSPGLPSIDCCPWLSVHVGGYGVAAVGAQGVLGQGRKAAFVPQVTFVMLVARCTPGIERGRKFPTVASLELVAQLVNQDMWAITDAARKADKADTLFGGACREVEHLGAVPLDPAGGCGGWTIRWRATIEGITAETT